MGCQPGDFAYGHFNIPPGFVWVYMGQHTHFITPDRWTPSTGRIRAQIVDSLTVLGLKDIPLRGAEYKTLCSGVDCHPGDYRGLQGWSVGLCCLMTFGVMYDHTFYKQVQISRSDIRPHIKWAVSLVILHMITSIFLRALCGYIWVNILTLSPRGEGLQGFLWLCA